MVLAAQEVKVIFAEDPALVGSPKTPVTRVESEDSERNPTKSRGFFSTKTEEKMKSNGKIVAPKMAGAASEAPSLKSTPRFSAKYSIYSANVTVSATHALETGLRATTKKKLPTSFPFEMVFVSRCQNFNIVLCST